MTVQHTTFVNSYGREVHTPITTDALEQIELHPHNRDLGLTIWTALHEAVCYASAPRMSREARSFTHGQVAAYGRTLALMCGHTTTFWDLEMSVAINTPISEYAGA